MDMVSSACDAFDPYSRKYDNNKADIVPVHTKPLQSIIKGKSGKKSNSRWLDLVSKYNVEFISTGSLQISPVMCNNKENFLAGKARKAIKVWKTLTSDYFVLSNVTGISVNVDINDLVQSRPKNYFF